MRVLRIPALALLSLSRSRPTICRRLTGKHTFLTTPISHLPLALFSTTLIENRGRNSSPTTRLFSPVMADDKSRKQATLGYVRDKQQTIGCVDILSMAHAPFTPGLCWLIYLCIMLIDSTHIAGDSLGRTPISRQKSKPHWLLAERDNHQAVVPLIPRLKRTQTMSKWKTSLTRQQLLPLMEQSQRRA